MCWSCAGKERHARRLEAIEAVRRAHPCPICGDPVSVTPNGRPAPTCGKQICRQQRRRLGKYGIKSTAELQQMFEEQGGRCAVCKRPGTLGPPPELHGRRDAWFNAQSVEETAAAVPLIPDHHHATGLRRKLLCSPCNVAYGLLNESRERVLALLAYHDAYAPLLEMFT